MGWRQEEARIEQLRGMVGENPREAVRQITEELRRVTRPSDKVRLCGLLCAAHRVLGESAEGWRAYSYASELKRASSLARAELEAQAAALAMFADNDMDAGERHTAAAARYNRQVLDGPFGQGESAQRRRRWARTLNGAILITRGQVWLFRDGSARAARAEALQALTWIEDRAPGADRVRIAAVTLLGASAMESGTPAEMMAALEAVHAEERALMRRRANRKPVVSLALCQVRWCRALILARFGSLARAESILERTVLPGLARIGAQREWERAGQSLLWVIADRMAQHWRAVYVARKLGIPAPPVPARVAIDREPIGF